MIDKRMPISQHLRELRRRLIYSILIFFIIFLLCFIKADRLITIVIPSYIKMILISPTEAFLGYIRISFWVSTIVSFPHLCFQIWYFIRPALSKEEKRLLLFFMPFVNIMLFCGVLFGYYVILPFSLRFFLGFDIENYTVSVSLERYLSFALNCILPFGLVFQAPALILLLSKLGVVTYELLIKWRKYAIVIIFIIAAWCTPPDVVSQFLLAVPIFILYQMSIVFVKISNKRRTMKSLAETD